MEKCTAYSEAKSEFWYKCSRAPKCNTFFNSFKPLPHQQEVLQDGHKFILNAGGYGSAKTYTTRQLIYKQIMLNPKGLILVGANISRQYEQTIQVELNNDIPKEFVKSWSAQKQCMTFANGCRLIYSPFDDPDKLRSMNLSAWFIIEGSECDPNTFTQLKSRLRNMAAAKVDYIDSDGRTHYKAFRGKGVVETNPDAGWVRTDMLDHANAIYQHGTATSSYKPKDGNDKAISVHISSSDANPYLPDGYIKDLCANKPKWWIDRYIYGSFEFSNGLVCPKYTENIVPTFVPPDDWVRLIGHDPGIVDASAFVNIAVDDKKGIAYVYRDLQYHDMGVKELHERWVKEIAGDIKPTQMYTRPVMDGKMFGRRAFTDLQTLDNQWAQYGVYFQPGHIQVKDRIWRLNTYFEAGRLKIMDSCLNLTQEFKDYKWQKARDGSYVEKPVDKNNHSIDALQFAIMKLPENPAHLMYGAFTSFGKDLTKNDSTSVPSVRDWMFAKEETNEAGMDYWDIT